MQDHVEEKETQRKMVIKRRDFQKAAAFIHEFLLKMNEDVECAELRDTLNLALLHMQKYYKMLQSRSQEKNAQNTLSLSARGLSPMTPFVDAPDKFRWRWVNLDNARLPSNMSTSDSINLTTLPPMIRAVKAGNIKVMQELIKQDPNVVDDHDGIGRTGLMYAVHHTEHNALNYLLESRADVNAVAHDGSTAMHYACHESNVVALSLLLDHGAHTRIVDTQGRAPIHWAVTTPSTECLELLVEHDADPMLRDKDGLTPCMWACRMDNIKHFDLLCQANYVISEADGTERDSNGRTWMHWAVRRTEPLECLQTILTPESARYKDEDGKTVLMLAAEIGSLPATRLILEIGGTSTLNDCEYQSRTALHLATIGGHGDVVNFLLDQGADINQPDRFNATAWDYARNRQLHYCQLIIMSHQRQRMISNPTSPLPNGLGLLMHSENGVQEGLSQMSFRSRSEQSTPITPPHPPKRPRMNRMLQRRVSLTSEKESTQQEQAPITARISNSAGQERKKERIEVTVNTRMASNQAAFQSVSRQDSTMTEDVDITNVMNDVEINGEEDIDNVSVGGMDVSDIEDADQQNGQASYVEMQEHQQQQQRQPGVGNGRPQPAQRPPGLGRQQQQQPLLQPRQPQPPREAGYQVVPPHPPTAAPSYTSPLEPPNSQEEMDKMMEDTLGPQPIIVPPPSYPPHALPRSSLRSSQQLHGSPGRGPVPSPPNLDPQKPHMIRHQQPLPPQPARRDPAPQSPGHDNSQGEKVSSPPLSSQSSDQISCRTQIHVGVGLLGGGGGGGSDPNRPTSGGTTKAPGVAIEGRRIPPPMLTPLANAPKPPIHDMFIPSMDAVPEKKKKKKKKGGGRMAGGQERDREIKSPPQNPLEIPPPRGFAAPLHPGRERGHSAALLGPKYSRGQPQQTESRFVEDNAPDDDKPPVINGFAVPIREGTARSARPGQRSAPMEVEDVTGPAGDATNSEGIRDSIVEEDEVGELFPPPQGFGGLPQQAGRPLSQSVPQDKASMRMAPTSAKPPLPRSSRNSASSTSSSFRRSSDKTVSPGRRSRPPTSKAS